MIGWFQNPHAFLATDKANGNMGGSIENGTPGKCAIVFPTLRKSHAILTYVLLVKSVVFVQTQGRCSTVFP